MSLAEYLKENKIDEIEDDQEFADAEYDAIQAYCAAYGYSITDADLKTVKARGLEESFMNWKESCRMGLQEEKSCQCMESV